MRFSVAGNFLNWLVRTDQANGIVDGVCRHQTAVARVVIRCLGIEDECGAFALADRHRVIRTKAGAENIQAGAESFPRASNNADGDIDLTVLRDARDLKLLAFRDADFDPYWAFRNVRANAAVSCLGKSRALAFGRMGGGIGR